jgi:N-acetylglucosamine kinase-like BadF-type ATPase
MVRENSRELLGKLTDSGRTRLILAVDGGDSKVDVVLVDTRGIVVGATRNAGSAHFGLDHNGHSPLETVSQAVEAASRDAGVDPSRRPLADIGVYCVAGADLPLDDRRIAAVLGATGWTPNNIVRNDTFAVLRAGTDREWGVAVVCGTGLNCAAVGPDGRVVRFPSLGEQSGDQAHGGGWLGRAALGAAVRARDGRGPRTALEKVVPAHFKMTRPTSVMEAIYFGRLDEGRLSELPPLVFRAAAAGDEVSRRLIDQVADEVVANAAAAIRRLRVASRDVEVILGGGVIRSGDRRLLGRIRSGILSVAPRAMVRRLESPPVLGAAFIGLDRTGASRAARARLRGELTHKRLGRAAR